MTGFRIGEALENALFFGIPAIIFLTTALTAALLYFPAPHADYWDHINWLRAMQTNPFTVKDLFRQANEHRIAVPRLAFMLDDALVSSRGVICVAVIFASVTLAAALFAWVGVRELRGLGAKFVVFVAVGFSFLLNQYENFLWENQVQFLFVYVFAALGAYVAVNEAERPEGARPAMLAAAGLATLIATYSMANGFVVYVALVACFVMTGRYRHAAGWLVFGAAALASYLYGYVRPGHHPDPAGVFDKLGLVLLHFQNTIVGLFDLQILTKTSDGALIAFNGPFNRMNPTEFQMGAGQALAGCAVVYLLARMLLTLVGRRKATVGEQLFIVVALYALGSCMIMSLGRAELSVLQGVASRYQTPVNLFWMSVFALLAYDLARFEQPRWKMAAGATLTALTLALTGLFAGTQWVGWRDAAARALQLGVATDALLVGVPDRPALTALFPVADVALGFSDVLKKERRSLFADKRYDALNEARTLPGGEALIALGAVDVATEMMDDAGGRGLRLKAQVNGLSGTAAGRAMIVTDACDRVVGFGRLATGQNAAETKLRIEFKAKPSYLTAYVRVGGDKTACLQSTGDPRQDYRLSVAR